LENLLLLLFNIFLFLLLLGGRRLQLESVDTNDSMNGRRGCSGGGGDIDPECFIISRMTQTESENTERERKRKSNIERPVATDERANDEVGKKESTQSR
jgi:hypothetical protein